MKTTSGRTKNVFIAIAILALLILAGSWLYLNSLQPTVKVVSDKPAYFVVDNPQVEVMLLNTKNANSGTVRLSYDNKILTLESNEPAEGVTADELNNNLIYELSNEYFESGESVVATLTFDYTGNSGTAELLVDENKSVLSANEEEIKISKFESASFEIGVAPTRN